MIRGLYDWTISLAAGKHALWALAVVAFVESSFFPIPPDVLMIPMIIATPQRAFLIAGVAMVSSVLGGIFGYAIGAFAFEQVGQPILESLGKADSMAAFNEKFNEHGVVAVFVAGLTPFPYKVITIMSGWTGLPFWAFMATSFVARGGRFFLVAWLLHRYGEPIRYFIEKRLGLVTALFVALLVGGFYVVKYL